MRFKPRPQNATLVPPAASETSSGCPDVQWFSLPVTGGFAENSSHKGVAGWLKSGLN